MPVDNFGARRSGQATVILPILIQVQAVISQCHVDACICHSSLTHDDVQLSLRHSSLLHQDMPVDNFGARRGGQATIILPVLGQVQAVISQCHVDACGHSSLAVPRCSVDELGQEGILSTNHPRKAKDAMSSARSHAIFRVNAVHAQDVLKAIENML